MRKRRIALVVAIALVLVLALAGCNTENPISSIITESPTAELTPTPSLENTPIPTPKPSLPPDPLAISTQLISMEDSYVKIHVEYPVFSGMVDTAFQTHLNAMIENDANNRVTQLHNDAEAAYGDPYFVKYTLDSQVSIHKNDGMLISVSIRYQDYTGGAHGGTDGLFINVLNKPSGEQLSLLDLFTDGLEGKSRINDAISTQIGGDADYTFSSITNNQWFYVEGNELVVVFEAYAIGPGAMGEPEFSIPLSSLSELLIPAIQP